MNNATPLRLRVIRTIWTAYVMVMILLMVTNIVADATPGVGEIILGMIISVAAMVSTIVVWTDGQEDDVAQKVEKAKRSTGDLDDMLDNLSDQQLARLRQRLSMDEPEIMMLSDDGELWGQKRNQRG